MLTFEEWRHTYADVFATDDAARAAWTAACNRGYRTGMQDTRALLAAHSAGAQPKGVGMQAQMIASRICSALEADKDDGYDLEAGLFGKAMSALIRELAAMSLSDGAQEPVAWRYQSEDPLDGGEWLLSDTKPNRRNIQPLYTYPQPMPQTDASRHLSDLLARIHRDGGQYEAEHGVDKAVADADDKVARLNAMTDATRDVIEAARIVLGAGLAKDISGNGVKVFVTSVSAAERLSAASAEIERLDRAKGE